MPQLHLPRLPQSGTWDTLTHNHYSVLQMFLFYALPLSLVPAAMMYFAGGAYGQKLLPALNDMQLVTMGILFFLAETAVTFLVAYAVRRLGQVVDIKIAYENAYKLSVVAATPLWLAPLCLFVPNAIINIAANAAALMLAGILIYYNVPAILNVEEGRSATMLSGAILVVGMVAWAAMMFFTFVSWTYVTSSLFFLR